LAAAAPSGSVELVSVMLRACVPHRRAIAAVFAVALAVSAGLLAVWARPAVADWSAPTVVPGVVTSVYTNLALAVDARGDVAVAWESHGSWPARWQGRPCSPAPVRAGCFPLTAVHLAVATASGRLVTRMLWSQRADPGLQISVVINHHEVTVAWGYLNPGSAGDTVRAAYGPLVGRWAPSRAISGRWRVGFTIGPPSWRVALALAPNGTVLAAWDGCSSKARCQTMQENVVAAWRSPGRAFTAPEPVAAAPLGGAPAFDAAGTAYLASSCSGSVAIAPPGSRRFRPAVVTSGPVSYFKLSLSGAGQGLAAWVAGACSYDEEVLNAPGPVLAATLSGGSFTPAVVLAAAPTQAEDVIPAAVPAGGGSVSWFTYDGTTFTALSVAIDAGGHPGATVSSANPMTEVGSDSGGDLVFAPAPVTGAGAGAGSVLVQPASGGAAQIAPATPGSALALAPSGRVVVCAWYATGGLDVSVWRP